MSKIEEISKKELEILRILSESSKPISSSIIKRELEKRGIFLSERSVRHHLQLLELRGLVSEHEHSGRIITTQGLEELSRALVSYRLGFTITRFISMAYSVTYDPFTNSGMVVANAFIMDKYFSDKMLDIVKALYDSGLLLAPYIKVLDEGEEYENIAVSKGEIALLTVCDLTIDGVLIHSGVPLFFKYGGLVQMIKYKPISFLELISYEGATIPPLDLFVRSNLTSIMKVVRTGSGLLPVAFREIVAGAYERTIKILSSLKKMGWAGILAIGSLNEPLLNVPVAMDRFGLCMIGGLTPGAALKEEKVKVLVFAPHCLIHLEEMKQIS